MKKSVDLTRRASGILRDRANEDTFTSVFMSLTILFLDVVELPGDTRVPSSVSSNVSISNVGNYPYKPKDAIKTLASGGGELSIESVHVHNSSPHLNSAVSLTVVSTDKLCYSMMYKHEAQDAERVFAASTKCVKRVDEIPSEVTMAQVVDRVAEVL